MRPLAARFRPIVVPNTATTISSQTRRCYSPPAMQAASRIRTALAGDRPAMGMWQMIPGANVSRILARTGVDWVCVDCEHGNIDGSLPSSSWCLRVVRGVRQGQLR